MALRARAAETRTRLGSTGRSKAPRHLLHHVAGELLRGDLSAMRDTVAAMSSLHWQAFTAVPHPTPTDRGQRDGRLRLYTVLILKL